MILSQPRGRSPAALSTLAAVSVLGCGLLAACGATSGTTAAQHPQAGQHTRRAQAGRPAQPVPGRFSAPVKVDNRMFPLVPGTQFAYRGKVVAGAEPARHSVVFTVTDLTKMVGHVRTVVVWDRDFRHGDLEEQELALFAQDDNGAVWNFGEYPEEYSRGKLTGAPDTWISGIAGAYGGVHMLAHPEVGARYQEGLVPAIEFDDVSTVASTSQQACARTGCYHRVLMIDETSPNDPGSGHQLKYYAAGLGLIRVGAHGGDSQEFLTLAAVRHLSPRALAKVRAAVLTMDRRAYRVSKVYRATGPAERRRG